MARLEIAENRLVLREKLQSVGLSQPCGSDSHKVYYGIYLSAVISKPYLNFIPNQTRSAYWRCGLTELRPSALHSASCRFRSHPEAAVRRTSHSFERTRYCRRRWTLQ